jgi:hypothetical protein
MEFSEDLVKRAKAEFRGPDGKEMSDDEAREALRNLAGYVELVWKAAQRQARLERRLRKEPEGFPVEGHYSCLICGSGIDETTGWYHWGGQRCLLCHRAITTGVIPAYVVRGRDSYYAMWALKSKFNIHPQTARKLVRLGELKARIILDDTGKTHEYIFLKRENPHLADPERYSPGRKSYNRHRDKVSKRQGRELAKKLREDAEEMRNKHRAK